MHTESVQPDPQSCGEPVLFPSFAGQQAELTPSVAVLAGKVLLLVSLHLCFLISTLVSLTIGDVFICFLPFQTLYRVRFWTGGNGVPMASVCSVLSVVHNTYQVGGSFFL